MEKDPLLKDPSVEVYSNPRHDVTGSYGSTERKHQEAIEENKTRPWEKWRRNQVIPAVVLLGSGFFGMMSRKTVGPSLLDLQIRTGASIEQASWFMSVYAMGSMSGALVLGFFIDRRSRWFQICLTMFLAGLAHSCVPWLKPYWAELIMFVASGFFTSYITAASQLTIYSLFDNKDDCVSWQNVCQLVYALGALFAPVVVQPFLLEAKNTNITDNNATVFDSDDVRVMFGYMIPGGGLILVSGIAVLTYCLLGTIEVSNKRNATSSKTPDQEQPRSSWVFRMGFIVLLVIYYIVQSVILRTFNNYIVPFSVGYFGWTKSQATNLATAYFAAAVVCKTIVIFIVRFVSLEILLFGGLILSNVAGVALSFFIDWHNSIIWVFSMISSLGSCITVSVLIAWTDKYVGIAGSVGVVYSWAGAVGEVAFNPVIGYLFENVSYISLMYLLLAASVTCLLITIVMQIIGSRCVRKV